MHDEQSHPLLQQTALSVNPYIDLPKPPTLAHNYAAIPSTLPPSSISAPATATNPDLPAYVTSASGFAAHPSTIIAQNKALLEQIKRQREQADKTVQEWDESIKQRELMEKRRKAPGWLDSESKMLEPAKPATAPAAQSPPKNIMDGTVDDGEKVNTQAGQVDDLGAAMDRAFGKGFPG